ncbi:MAG: serine/threonine-protein kinase [Trueperaceae bacterium]
MFSTVRVLAANGPIRVELARKGRRLVVVKRLQGFHPELERRLTREAEVVRKLDHDGILPLLEVRDGVLVYPYLPGVDLDVALEAGPLPLPRVAAVARHVLEALAYAHRLGIVHHDVKPGNVRLRGERAVLLDFGFAKDVALASITASRQALGTPNYMAPEQFSGQRDDPRSDLYGVAASCYHALSGRPPYGRDVLRVLLGDLAPTLEPLPQGCAALEAWILRGLALDPCDRPPDADAMRSDLERVLAGAAPARA